MTLLSADRTLVMGILNVTPDSFSDGGHWFSEEQAIDRGLQLVGEGADIVDVGGESTRPGAVRPDLTEELRRVIPVVTALAEAGVVVSVDTMRAKVAQACVEAGAAIINDVSGGLADPNMIHAVANLGVPYIAMHWRAHGAVMQDSDLLRYDDVVAGVCRELQVRVDTCLAAGISTDNLVLDPGIGFSKTSEHNWELLRRIDEVIALGFPLLVGASRKRFLGELLRNGQVDREPIRRDAATAALTTVLAQHGIWAVRTHSVWQHRDAIAVVEKLGAH